MPLTPLSEADVADIVARRLDKGALGDLQAQYHIGSKRVVRIWKEHGVFDRKAITAQPKPVAPDGQTPSKDRISRAGLRPRASQRKSKAEKFEVAEPSSPLGATPEAAEVGGATELTDDPANAQEEKLRSELGSLAAGNDSAELAESTQEDLADYRAAGGLSAGQDKKLSTESAAEAAANNDAKSESESSESEESESSGEIEEDADEVAHAPRRPARTARQGARGRRAAHDAR